MAESGKRMSAVVYDSYGGGAAGLKHVELPVPKPKKGEILVKVEATSLNPVDWKVQKGVGRPLFPRKFPHIPCSDIAGEVVEVGSGVKNFNIGDKIVSTLHIREGGGLAEYAVAKESVAAKLPPEVPSDQAAGLGIACLTAHQALAEIAGIKLDGTGPRKNILVTAASGGVGTYAVQLAKLGNTHITATCGARNFDLVRSLGADDILDYRTPEGAALKSPSGLKYDAVVHGTTGIPWSTFEQVLNDGAKVIDISPGPSTYWSCALKRITFQKKQLVPVALFTPKAESLEFLVSLVKEGKLKTIIDSKHPLNKAEDAWSRSMEGHATGKIIVEP